VGLLVSGLFFSLAIIRYGVRRFREEQLNHADSDIRIGRWWDVAIGLLVPVQAVILLVWWLVQAWSWDPEGWLTPFAAENVGTVLFQFAVVLAVLIAANRWAVRRGRSDSRVPDA
jgi:NSS family neurotransmitter:Na+ symporter